MYRTFSILVLVGLIVWGFLLLSRYAPGVSLSGFSEEVDDATKADRCAQFRTTEGVGLEGEQADDGTWKLGYGGRIRQIVHGCF